MALDIGIKAPPGNIYPIEKDLIVSLEHVEFSFLLDTFSKLEKTTGVKISDCDDARIEGGQLETFVNLIEDSISIVSRKPNVWDEFVGYGIHPRKKHYEKIRKQEFLAKLKNLVLLSKKANENEKQLFFFGD